jgi:hypothetical protein
VIPIDDEYGNRKWLYIIYKGQVTLKVVALAEPDQKNAWKKEERSIVYSTTRIAQSGQLFDFRSLGFLRDSSSVIAQNQQHKHKLHSAKALSDTVVLFRFPADLMADKIACDPTTRLMWKELLMENLLRIVQRHFYKAKQERVVSRHVSGSTHDNNGNDAIHPAFWPLEAWEEPEALRAGSGKAWKNIILHTIKSMQWSFTPPWPLKGFPVGLRHKIYLQAPVPVKEDAANQLRKPVVLENGDAESQSLVQSEPSSVEYQSIGSFRQEDDFLEYLDEMDEATGLGLNISFLVNSHHGSENSDMNIKKREEQRS